MYPIDQMNALRDIYGSGVTQKQYGQNYYVFIPGLLLPQGCFPERSDALFCTQPFAPTIGGYTSRLFLKENIKAPCTPSNYQSYIIGDETWYGFSHNNVAPGLFPEMIINHLRGFLVAC